MWGAARLLFRRAALCLALVAPVLPLAASETAAQDQIEFDPAEVNPELPALISADEVTYDESLEVVTATGNVEIAQGDRVLLADSISYNLKTEVVTAAGKITVLEPTGEVLFADYVALTDELREGFVQGIKILLQDKSRIAAASAVRVDGNRTVMRNAVFSPCELCKEDPTRAPLWQLKAARIEHDQEEQVVRYGDAWMEFFGVPVIYTPYFEHPDPTVKRKSGFLAPSFGSSETLGATFQLPYFWDIAPDRDVTVEPIFTTKQSVVLAGEYRQLLEDGRIEIRGSGTFADRKEDDGTTEENKLRGHIDAEGRFDINETWRWGFDANRSTDDTYLRLYNLDGARTLTTSAFAEGFRGRNYMAVNNFLFQGLRSTDNNDEQPIIFPMLDYNVVTEPSKSGATYNLDANFLVLSRIEGRETRRAAARAAWELPYTSPIGDVYKLTASVQGSAYWVEGFNPEQENLVAPQGTGEGDFLTAHFFPQLALQWSYPWVNDNEDFSQVFEPVVQVVAAPDWDVPDEVPNEDSQDFEFDDTNLFSLNRFAGFDRVDPGSRVDYGLRWSAVSPALGQSNAFFGQSYRLEEEDDFGNGSGLEDNVSDFVGRVQFKPVEYFDLLYRVRLDKDNLAPRRSELDATIGPPALQFDISYLDLSDESDQGEFDRREELRIGVRSRLTEYWSAFASHQRDLDADQSLKTEAGITYHDECFLIEAVAARSFFEDRDIEPEDSIFFRVVLKHLGEFGSS